LYISYDGHPGYDYPVPRGTDVLAAADGKVTLSCPNELGEIDVDHGNGLFTMYNHLSKCVVGVGNTVTKGQVIGASGKTRASYPHLHFSVFKGYPAPYKYVDPYGWDPIVGADVLVDPHTETSICLWEVCQ
jgi:murein DD-endopeptidase MepM/ murein hydrolase activator NlpD